MYRYSYLKRRYLKPVKLPRALLNNISDLRGIKRRSGLSPLRNVVYILYWNIGGRFDAKVLGDDLSEVPVIVDSNVDDDEIRDCQECMLYLYMREKKMTVTLDMLRGETVFLGFAKKGQRGFMPDDFVIFDKFGIFNEAKIDSILNGIGKVKAVGDKHGII